jgi:hypothetical protein
MSRVSRFLLPLAAGFFFAACAEPAQKKIAEPGLPMAMTDGATHQLNRDEPWYEHPAQARPANGRLTASTRVKLLQDVGSFAKVQTADGKVCFVATDSLSPLPR